MDICKPPALCPSNHEQAHKHGANKFPTVPRGLGSGQNKKLREKILSLRGFREDMGPQHTFLLKNLALHILLDFKGNREIMSFPAQVSAQW